MTDYDALIDLVAAHRPYGIDCKCGGPINSDRDWAHHLAQMLAITEEGSDIFTHVCRCPGCGCSSCELETRREEVDTGRWGTQARIVGPWREVTDA
jgi:hypothetical protein